MTPCQSKQSPTDRTDPFRWDPHTIARAYEAFANPDSPPSQRQYAQQHGLPRSTLGYWLRQPDPPDCQPPLTAFLRSPCGQDFLRRLVLALLLVFRFRGACGLRLLGLFLQLSQLDRFVASSHGALHQLDLTLQAQLAAFASEERTRLASTMTPQEIAVVADEHFHAATPCLVAIEPASNFILVEQYQPHRDADTWTAALKESIADLPVEVALLASDQAKGILACARDGLQAEHLPELFHGQRDLCRALVGPLARQQQAAQKEQQQAQERAEYWQQQKAQAEQGPARRGRPKDYCWRIDTSASYAASRAAAAAACEARQQQVQQAVRGLADDYHPFEADTGEGVGSEQMEQRLLGRLQTLEETAKEASLGSKAHEALDKGRRWVVALVGALAWFWSMARTKVAALDLSEEAQRMVEERVLPGLYWQHAARRGRTAEQRQQRQALAERLLEQAWGRGSVLGRLRAEERERVEQVGREVVGLFARSSSCVEGRNGRLSLFHHGCGRLSGDRLLALTVVHNYLSERGDGTTAAERFFGSKPRDVFSWLLERLPNLPRPAAKRSQHASRPPPEGG